MSLRYKMKTFSNYITEAASALAYNDDGSYVNKNAAIAWFNNLIAQLEMLKDSSDSFLNEDGVAKSINLLIKELKEYIPHVEKSQI